MSTRKSLSELQLLAQETKLHTYSRELSDEEINSNNQLVVMFSVEEADLNDQWETLKAEWRLKRANAKLKLKQAVSLARNHSEQKSEICYFIANVDANVMEIYNSDGEFIEERPLRASEKANANIFQMRKSS